MKIFYKILLIGITVSVVLSCKRDFLEKKPNSGFVVPTELADFQKLMDNIFYLNDVSPELLFFGSDDIYITDGNLSSLSSSRYKVNAYKWETDIFSGTIAIKDWNDPYQQIYYANVVLEGLNKMGLPKSKSNAIEWNTIFGQALFKRAYAYHELAQLFAVPYDIKKSSTDLGVPLRVSSNVNLTYQRSSVYDTYQQIIKDLEGSKNKLSDLVDFNNPNRASKPAAFACLARVYLNMGAFETAELYADSCLRLHNKLIDFNGISITASSPFARNNDELLYFSRPYNQAITSSFETRSNVDTNLYKLYNDNDLRKVVYFRIASGLPVRKGTYAGGGSFFTGLATDEIYLIRAECRARLGKVQLAMDDLNQLMIKRWKNSVPYPVFTASSSQEALNIILLERRKELVMRGTRWSDLRRLNTDKMNITLKRIAGGLEYSLQPNDKRYVYPVPDDEIAISGIEQNER